MTALSLTQKGLYVNYRLNGLTRDKMKAARFFSRLQAQVASVEARWNNPKLSSIEIVEA